MALRLLITGPGGSQREVPLLPGRTSVVASAAEQYRLVGAAGEIPASVRVLRDGNTLVVQGLPDGQELELGNFFGACRPGRDCSLGFDAPGAPTESITNESLPIAALNDGSFLLLGTADGALPVAVSTVSDTGGPSVGAVVAGLLGVGVAVGVAGGGGGGGGGGSAAPTAVLGSGPTDAGGAAGAPVAAPPTGPAATPDAGTPAPPPAPTVPTEPLDTVAPTLSITDNVAGTASGPVVFTFRFSEPVVAFDPGGVTVTGGAASPLVAAGDGTTWTMTVQPEAQVQAGTVSVSVGAGAARDAAGNASAAVQATQAYDTRGPVATVTDDVAGTANGPVRFSFSFDEPIAGLDASEVLISGGTLAAFSGVPDARGFQVSVAPSPGVAAGTITVDLPAGAATDAVGNPNAALRAVQDYDTLAPQQRVATFVVVDNQPRVTGNVIAGTFTDDRTPTFTLTLDNVLQPGERLTVARNGLGVGTLEAGAGSLTVSDRAGTGTQTYSASITDAAGNVATLDLNGALPGNDFSFLVV